MEYVIGFMACFLCFMAIGTVSLIRKERMAKNGPNSVQDVGERITIVKGKGQ